MFTALDNKTVGQNIAKLRRHRDIKAAEMAGRLELSESAYTKYERGETSITIDFLNKVAEQFEVTPQEFLNATPQNIVETVHASQVNFNTPTASGAIGVQNITDQDLVKAVIEQNKALTELLQKLSEKLS